MEPPKLWSVVAAVLLAAPNLARAQASAGAPAAEGPAVSWAMPVPGGRGSLQVGLAPRMDPGAPLTEAVAEAASSLSYVEASLRLAASRPIDADSEPTVAAGAALAFPIGRVMPAFFVEWSDAAAPADVTFGPALAASVGLHSLSAAGSLVAGSELRVDVAYALALDFPR